MRIQYSSCKAVTYKTPLFTLLFTLVCAGMVQFSSAQTAIQAKLPVDVSLTDPSTIDWADVQGLSASGDNLQATLKNGAAVLMSRTAYVEYARKNNKVSSEPPTETIEIAPTYPGGRNAWARHLMRNLRYPEKALYNRVVGTVVVQFLVDEKGKVKDIKALTHLGSGLEAEAIRLVRQSGRWIPGIENLQLKSGYLKQSITFMQ